jgi:hypothetical protein
MGAPFMNPLLEAAIGAGNVKGVSEVKRDTLGFTSWRTKGGDHEHDQHCQHPVEIFG